AEDSLDLPPLPDRAGRRPRGGGEAPQRRRKADGTEEGNSTRAPEESVSAVRAAHTAGTHARGRRDFRGESEGEAGLARSCSTTELFPRHSATWYHGSVRVSPQGLGRVLGRHRVDEEPAAPLESCHARELRDDLEVPVERLELAAAQGRRVEHEVERGVPEHAVHPAQEVAQEPGESVQL